MDRRSGHSYLPQSSSSLSIDSHLFTDTGSVSTFTLDHHDHDEIASTYIPLLVCPVCDPPCMLVLPTTLHCGHTVCSSHVAVHEPAPSPPCPLSTCPSNAPSPKINIPPSSRVAYFPAPASTPLPLDVRTEPRVDITVSKVISLVRRAQVWEEHAGFVPEDDDSGSETEDDDDAGGSSTPPLPSSVAAGPSHPNIQPSPNHTSFPNHPCPSPTGTYRPHKRRKRAEWRHTDDRDVGLSAHARFQKDLMAELTCEICFMLLYQPVTTPCQHTFCSKCLHRSLDHSTSCPLCRTPLSPYTYFQPNPTNHTLLALILHAFPAHVIEQEVREKERDARLDTPIFVCQLSFPGMPTVLHFFEPRYRLMLRRCLENPTPCFGMIMAPKRVGNAGAENGNEYGTMLEIRSVQMLADGRSMVETWGTYRFRILETGALDGYMVGRIERIDDYEDELDADYPVPPPAESTDVIPHRPLLTRLLSTRASSSLPTPPRTNEHLMSICRSFLDRLRQGAAPWVVQRLDSMYGPMPTDPSTFSFWVALVLPIEEHEKAKLLPIKSARLRLRLVVHWIEQLNGEWFSSGCIIA